MKTKMVWMAALCCLLAGCAGKKPEAGAAAGDKEKELAFTLPQVPVMLQSAEDRLHYVARHYWDCFDFRDTAYIHVPEVTEQALVNYLDVLKRLPTAEADSCLTTLMQTAARGEEKMLRYLGETLRRYLFDPNSPMRYEPLYEPVCRFFASCGPADEAMRSRAQHDLKLVRMNCVGSPAADFTYTLPSGTQKRMYGIASPYLLLVFYNPDCHGCTETLAALKASPVLNAPAVTARLKVLAFYPDEDREAWERHRHELPAAWIDSYDKNQTVLDREVYDLKAMPTLYLLDRSKTVLLKDATVREIEEYFENKSL